MRSPWKAFFGETALLFALGVACTYIARIWIIDKYSPLSDPSAIYVSMNIGALTASMIISVIGALCFWRLQPLMWAVALCSALISGNPVITIVAPVLASATYVLTNKLRMLLGFYWPHKRAGTEE